MSDNNMTPEQMRIAEKITAGKSLAIEGKAGAAKSSTLTFALQYRLRHSTRAIPKTQIVVFNRDARKSLADKGATHVNTLHSKSYQYVLNWLRPQSSNPKSFKFETAEYKFDDVVVKAFTDRGVKVPGRECRKFIRQVISCLMQAGHGVDEYRNETIEGALIRGRFQYSITDFGYARIVNNTIDLLDRSEEMAFVEVRKLPEYRYGTWEQKYDTIEKEGFFNPRESITPAHHYYRTANERQEYETIMQEIILVLSYIQNASARQWIGTGTTQTLNQYLTIFHSLAKTEPYGCVIADEAQDIWPTARIMIRHMLSPGGQLIIVGDPYQSINGWCGSEDNVMGKFATEFNLEPESLSQTFRCAPVICSLAETHAIKIVPFHKERTGSIRITTGPVSGYIEQGTMVICRYNKPLLKAFCETLPKGLRCNIRGVSISQILVARLFARYNIPLRYTDGKGEVKATSSRQNKDVFYGPWRLVDILQTVISNSKIAVSLGDIDDPIDDDEDLEETKRLLDETLRRVVIKHAEGVEEFKRLEDLQLLITAIAENYDKPGENVTLFTSIHRAKGLEC